MDLLANNGGWRIGQPGKGNPLGSWSKTAQPFTREAVWLDAFRCARGVHLSSWVGSICRRPGNDPQALLPKEFTMRHGPVMGAARFARSSGQVWVRELHMAPRESPEH